jgi:hypothetical protein
LAAHLTQQSVDPLPFRIVCPDNHVLELLQSRFESQHFDASPMHSPIKATWQDGIPNRNQSAELVALTIAAVATPDPMSILWEDYSMSWVQKLGLTACQHELEVVGPRYLMPADDIGWALHELNAAYQAMTCHIEILDEF